MRHSANTADGIRYDVHLIAGAQRVKGREDAFCGVSNESVLGSRIGVTSDIAGSW